MITAASMGLRAVRPWGAAGGLPRKRRSRMSMLLDIATEWPGEAFGESVAESCGADSGRADGCLADAVLEFLGFAFGFGTLFGVGHFRR